MVEYTYDAWGRCRASNTSIIGELNPYRYRGYYWDKETGLYFLNTRYYDPTCGRFISSDDVSYIDPETIGGTNLFAYCNNNPVMFTDETGTKSKWFQWAVSVAEVAVGVALIATGAIAIGFDSFSMISHDIIDKMNLKRTVATEMTLAYNTFIANTATTIVNAYFGG